MKTVSWITALLGLWIFGDIAGLVVIGIDKVSPGIWNHIAVGLLLIIAGVWSARTADPAAARPGTARGLRWIAAAAGLWLAVSRFVLGFPSAPSAIWNDVITGGLALTLNLWALWRGRAPR